MSHYQPIQPESTPESWQSHDLSHQQLQPYSPHSAPMPYSAPMPQSAPMPTGYHPMPPILVMPPEPKSAGIAYVLAFFLGGFGAHNFYLGRTGVAIPQLLLWFVGVLTIWLTVGTILWLALVIWVVVDLFCIAGWVREINTRKANEYYARTGHLPYGHFGY